MANRIRVGQVWKKVGSEETFLVTRLYEEALATFAVLRATAAADDAATLRVKVQRSSGGQTLPGFAVAHEVEDS
jgi:hypothetical protein